MNTSRFLIALGVILCLVLSPVIALMPANTAQAQPADSAPGLCSARTRSALVEALTAALGRYRT